MNICLFTKDEITKPLLATDERALHLNKILHKKLGDTFSCGIIDGKAGTATITKTTEIINQKTGKIDIQYEFTFKEESDGKPLFPLIMIIGFPRPIQLKRLLRDVAALGVCQVHLTGTQLGEKSYMQSTLVQKGSAYQMLLDGTVQAASTHVPELFLHSTLKECLESIKLNFHQDEFYKNIALDNVEPQTSLQSFINENSILQNSTSKKIVAAIGSERGWTSNERKILKDFNFTLCSMGSRVMRTETAATVSASIILSNLGFLD